MFNNGKKDHWYAGIAGLITAVFLYIVLTVSRTPLEAAGVKIPLWTLLFIMPAGEIAGYYFASKFFPHYSALRQFGRYVIVGSMNFMVDVGILSVLGFFTGVYGGLYIILLNFVSGSIAISNSYFWNRSWTFTEKAAPRTREFAMFVFVTAIGWLINSAIVYAITKIVATGGGLTPERLLVAAKVSATFVSVLWNFFGYKYVVFRQPHESASAAGN